MFRSQLSGKLYPAGTKPKRVVVKTATRTYVNEEGIISQGHETVQELVIGPDEEVVSEQAEGRNPQPEVQVHEFREHGPT